VVAKSGKTDKKRSHRPEAVRRQPDAKRPSQSPSRSSLGAARHTPSSVRPKLDTLGYEDRPRAMRGTHGSSPELITIEEAPIGRATQAAIEHELRDEPIEAFGALGAPIANATPAEIFEISTFVVTGDEIYGKASEASRRAFVAERVLHRLPVVSMEDVIRIDLSRSPTPNTVILRVWTKVSHRGQ
jgi:hypothetical protein